MPVGAKKSATSDTSGWQVARRVLGFLGGLVLIAEAASLVIYVSTTAAYSGSNV